MAVKRLTDPKVIQSLFDSALRSQFAWRRKADHLLRAGRVVLENAATAQPLAAAMFSGGSRAFSAEEMEPFENYLTFDIGFFLIALAIENLLKGLWIGRNYEAVKKAKSVKELKEIKKHDLDQIAKSAGLSLTSDEESLLSDLTKLIVWHGRYILPTTSEAYAPQFLNGPPSNRFLKGNGILNM